LARHGWVFALGPAAVYKADIVPVSPSDAGDDQYGGASLGILMMAAMIVAVLMGIMITIDLSGQSSTTGSHQPGILVLPGGQVSVGAQGQALSSAAEQEVVSSLTVASSYSATNNGSFGGLGATQMSQLEPGISYTAGSSGPVTAAGAASSPVSVAARADGQTVGFAVYMGGPPASCAYALDVAAGAGGLAAGSWWATGPVPAGGCMASANPDQPAGATSSSWARTVP